MPGYKMAKGSKRKIRTRRPVQGPIYKRLLATRKAAAEKAWKDSVAAASVCNRAEDAFTKAEKAMYAAETAFNDAEYECEQADSALEHLKDILDAVEENTHIGQPAPFTVDDIAGAMEYLDTHNVPGFDNDACPATVDDAILYLEDKRDVKRGRSIGKRGPSKSGMTLKQYWSRKGSKTAGPISKGGKAR